MLSIKLLFFCVLVYTTVHSFQNITLFQDLHFKRIEKTLTISFQRFDKICINFLFQWFDIYNISFAIHFVMKLTFICIISLTLLLVIPKPITFFRFADRVEERDYLLERFLYTIGKTWETADCYFSGFGVGDFEMLLHGYGCGAIIFIYLCLYSENNKNTTQQNPSITPLASQKSPNIISVLALLIYSKTSNPNPSPYPLPLSSFLATRLTQISARQFNSSNLSPPDCELARIRSTSRLRSLGFTWKGRDGFFRCQRMRARY